MDKSCYTHLHIIIIKNNISSDCSHNFYFEIVTSIYNFSDFFKFVQ